MVFLPLLQHRCGKLNGWLLQGILLLTFTNFILMSWAFVDFLDYCFLFFENFKLKFQRKCLIYPKLIYFFFTSNFLPSFVPWLVVIVWQFYVTPMNEIFRSMSSVKLTIKKFYPNFIKGVVKLLSSAIQKLILFNNKIIK